MHSSRGDVRRLLGKPIIGGDGSIELGIGTDAGLGRTQKDGKLPIVYVFGTENGKSVYMGDFQLTEVRQGSAGAKLTRPPYANEMSQWPKGEYLVRANILSNYLGTIGSLHTSVLVAEQAMNHEAAILKRLDKAVMKSQAALALRESELNGKPDAPETAGSDVKDGLVKALIDEEIIRNQIVDQVDDLRRDLSDKHLKLTTILAENETSVPKLARAAASKVAAEPVAVKKTAAAKKAGTVK